MEDIITALKNIEEEGSFCAKRTMSTDNLHLEIKQFGQLKFPLNSRNAKALIKLAKPAKFGWRDKTLLNKEVRNAWQISKNSIKINNVVWNKELKSTLELLKSDLGLPENVELKARLHNLLVYEPGQFFEYHQDSEKVDGMVASLIVVLPSSHSGGTLVIDNQGIKKQFQSSRFPLDKLTFIAFYADCHHAVKEVKEGYRLALTYNLILEKHAKKIHVPSGTKSFDDVIESLRSYFIDEDNAKKTSSYQHKSPKQFVYLLDHSYTQKGLSWNHLKNGDSLRAEAFKAAAEALGLEIHMALADVQETWDCETDYDSYEYRHRRKYSYYENDDEEEGNNEGNIELNELIDSSTTLRHWVDQKNKPLNYKECHVSSRHLGWIKASNEFEPFQSEYEGFMGNYGNTMDRWYHRAAIILWQKKDHYPVLFKMDSGSVINELLALSKKKAQEEHVRQIVNALLPYWSEYLRQNSENSVISTAFKLALYVKDSQLAQAMIAGFDIKTLTPERVSLFLSLQEAYGTSWCVNILQEWIKPKDRWGSASKCEKISEIVKNLSESKNRHKEITDWLLTYQLKKIIESNESCEKNSSRARLIEDTPGRIKEVMDFIAACVVVSNYSIYAELLNHITNHAELYPSLELTNVVYYLEETLDKKALDPWHYQKLFDYTYHEIKKEKDKGLRKKNDWSIKEKLSCACADCKTLSEYLQSDTVQHTRWPMGKNRRAHIHQAIDGLGIPVTHQTEHTGSPHKLILTKTDNLYNQAKQRFDRLEIALSRLDKINKKHPSHRGVRETI
jgi:hypothetical protein